MARSPRRAGMRRRRRRHAAPAPATSAQRLRRLGVRRRACRRSPVRYRSSRPPMMPRRRKHTSSTNTTPSTSFQAAPSPARTAGSPAGTARPRRRRSGPNSVPRAADRGLHHQLARGVEREGVRRHEGLQHAEQAAGEAGIGGGDHEGGQLVAVDVVADRRGAQRVVADRAEDRADRRAHDAQRDHDADEIADREELIERPAGGEMQRGEAEIEARRRHAGQAVLAAGPVRQRIELDEEEHLGDRHRDHREIDAGAPQRDQADQVADQRPRRSCR